jgi:uncharacterized protein
MLAALGSAAALVAFATAALTASQALPTLTEPVNDLAGVIDATSKAEMDRRIRVLEKTTGDAVVVATVKTLEPYGTIEEYANRLFEQAGIGKKKKDNGLLVVVAPADRQVRIEVGYDLEEFVPDGYAGDVIRRDMLPAFRDGKYGDGLLAGVTRIINRIAEKRGVALTDVPATADDFEAPIKIWSLLLPIGIIVVIGIIHAIRSSQHPGARGGRRPWGGWGGPFGGGFGGLGGFGRKGGGGWGGFGGGGGGFGGFGGGMSGGGGASGRW